MPTQTQYLKLIKPTTADGFSTADIAANWETLDKNPGTTICTSTSRPTLTQTQAGRQIYETDTDLMWSWTGTTWSRVAPRGLLKRTDGSKAHGVRTSDYQTTATTPTVAIAVTGVVVPPGNRTIVVTAQWSRAYSEVFGYFYGRLYRSAVSNTGPVLMQWAMNGLRNDTGAQENRGVGGSMAAYIRDGLPAGVYDFSLQAHVWAGDTATITGTPTYPNEIVVTEI